MRSNKLKYVYIVISGVTFGGFVFIVLPTMLGEYVLTVPGGAYAGLFLGIWFVSLFFFIAKVLKKK